ncbi:MAG TPA: hypothetical protein PKV67_03575 [Hyphomonas sp.]|nr:hypothetical protein [Hyphomonas sp.]HRI99829.1 hypothetical protein [Hyphomonas sp.]HRK66992.1 hypothetical protein [Hyphomonas sp.]
MTNELRPITYTYLFPVSDEDGSTSEARRGDLSDLLRDADSYLFSGNPVPPLWIMNDFLATGLSDLGMGGGARWEPFALDEKEYADFLRYLDTPNGRQKFYRETAVKIATPPPDVNTKEAYSVWKIRDAMADPKHHFNTTRVWAMIEGEIVTMTLGEAMLSRRDVTWHYIQNSD